MPVAFWVSVFCLFCYFHLKSEGLDWHCVPHSGTSGQQVGQSYCPTRDSNQLLLLLNSASKPLGWLVSHPKVLYSFCGRYFIVNISPAIGAWLQLETFQWGHKLLPSYTTNQPTMSHKTKVTALFSPPQAFSLLTQTEWLNKQSNKMPTVSVYTSSLSVKKHIGKFNLLTILMFCGFCCRLFQLFL